LKTSNLSKLRRISSVYILIYYSKATKMSFHPYYEVKIQISIEDKNKEFMKIGWQIHDLYAESKTILHFCLVFI
jgi:hypothetical protein